MSDKRSMFDVVRHVIDSLQEAQRDGRDRAGGAGHISGPRGRRTDYEFSARIGPETDETETTASVDHDHLLDVRRGEDEDHLLVVADLPDVDTDDLTVGIDREADDLVVGVDGKPVERVPLPWPDVDVDARFEHGVLEIHIDPAGNSE